MSKVRRCACVIVAAAASFCLAPGASANPLAIYSGSVSGAWSNPTLAGTHLDGGGAPASNLSNALTADCSLNGCPVNTNPTANGSAVRWGSTPGFSQVTFQGLPFADMPLDRTFQFGTLTYTNGTSALDTLIFGATLTLSLGDPGITDIPVSLGILTTSNTGTPEQNADFLSFSSVISLDTTFNVLEGQTAIADVFGHLTGDPTPVIDFIRIDPSSPPGAGFVGNGVPTPEPASLAMLATGMAFAGMSRRRRRPASGRSG
jgi:PEP-CTERM motif-containing protein